MKAGYCANMTEALLTGNNASTKKGHNLKRKQTTKVVTDERKVNEAAEFGNDSGL